MPKSDVSFLDDIASNKSNYTKGGAGAYSSVVKKLMTAFGEAVVGDLVANLKKNNSVASGNLESSINYTITEGTQIVFELNLLDYYQYVDQGRKPGRFPPEKPILEWIGYKRLNPTKKYASPVLKGGLKPKALSNISQMKSLAFLIRRKIAREGIKATNFYSDVINDKTLNQFITVLKEATRRDILIQLSREK